MRECGAATGIAAAWEQGGQSSVISFSVIDVCGSRLSHFVSCVLSCGPRIKFLSFVPPALKLFYMVHRPGKLSLELG